MIWNNHGSWESDIPWQLYSQKATLCEALLQLQLQTFLLLNIHLSLWAIQLIFIALSVSVIRDQLLVELITIIGSYEMMKKFVNTQKNGGTWWPWRITNPFLTSIALVTLSCGDCHTGNQFANWLLIPCIATMRCWYLYISGWYCCWLQLMLLPLFLQSLLSYTILSPLVKMMLHLMT